MARFTIVSTPAIVRFAAPTTAAPRMSGRAAQVARTASKAARKPLMIALPVQCTPSTTSRQAAENQGATASIAGLSTRTSPSRTVCQTRARRRRSRPSFRGGVDRRAHAGDRGAAGEDGRGHQREAGDHAADHPGGVAQRAAHAALLAAVDLRDLRALLDEHHQRVHARGQRDEDVVELEHQHPALEGRGARGAAHRLQGGAAALDRRDARERRLALAADRRRHLVGRERADGMRLADAGELALVGADRGEERVVPRAQVVERAAVGGDVLGAAAHPGRHPGHLVDALDERAGARARRAQAGGGLAWPAPPAPRAGRGRRRRSCPPPQGRGSPAPPRPRWSRARACLRGRRQRARPSAGRRRPPPAARRRASRSSFFPFVGR